MKTDGGNATLRFDSGSIIRGLFLFLVSAEMLLFTLDYHVNMAEGASSSAIRRLLNTAREDSLPGWFNIIQTTLIAVTIWAIWAVVSQSGTKWQKRGWLAIAVFFTYLALDDGAHIHERVGTWFDDEGDASALGAWALDMFPSYRWQIVFMPIFATMGFFIFGFLLRQLRGWKPKAIVFFALSCLATAITMDFFEGLADDHPLNPYAALNNWWHLDYWAARSFGESAHDTLVHFSRSFEECLEMFAMTMLWMVFLQHLMQVANGFRLRFEDTPVFPTAEDATPADPPTQSAPTPIARPRAA